MRQHVHAASLALACWVAAIMIPAPSRGDFLSVTVTNNQPSGGFALAPVWVGVHDGTFSAFAPGSKASTAIQAVAELGNTAPLQAAFAGQGAQGVVGSSPYLPGASATQMINVVNPTVDRYLSFAAMLVPSNDFFLGNANATAFALFDATGHFLGPKTIQIFASSAWDAGTEVNNVAFGAAFIVGDNASDHVDENGTIQPIFGGVNDNTNYLNSILGRATPGGYNISHLISPVDLIATINIVPEPAAFVSMGLGVTVIAAAGLVRRRPSHRA